MTLKQRKALLLAAEKAFISQCGSTLRNNDLENVRYEMMIWIGVHMRSYPDSSCAEFRCLYCCFLATAPANTPLTGPETHGQNLN